MLTENRNNFWLFLGMLLVCVLLSAVVRYQQFKTWEKTPAAYFVGERPMMTTLDAPYWLRWAREYNEGKYRQKGGLRGYPESTEISTFILCILCSLSHACLSFSSILLVFRCVPEYLINVCSLLGLTHVFRSREAPDFHSLKTKTG